MRILLAEDDAALAQRLVPLLEQAGYVVEVVADGRQAEEIGQIEDLQAAIVDLGLPGLDGLSVIERWRGNGRSFPVLVLTARGRWHDKLAGFDAGADDYLTKPFQADELVLRLRALIRRSHGHASPRLHCARCSWTSMPAALNWMGRRCPSARRSSACSAISSTTVGR